MKYIASCSFGKDSLAAIIVRLEHGEPVDLALYCRIMFDDHISAELPEHEEWIHAHAIPLLESRYGIKTEIVQAKKNYTDRFFAVKQKRTKNEGKIYGFPFSLGAWCNSKLKVNPLTSAQKSLGEYKLIVGIAADETKRIPRAIAKGQMLPLVDYGITEAAAMEICRANDLLSPAYNGGRERLGCWFCHNQRVGELQRLRREHPELWDKLMELDAVSPVKFKPDYRLSYYDARFWAETAQLKLPGFD